MCREDVVPPPLTDSISASDVSVVLRTAKKGVDELVKHGFLSAKLINTSLFNRPVFHIDRLELDIFVENHVSLYCLCKTKGLNARFLLRALEIADVKPIYGERNEWPTAFLIDGIGLARSVRTSALPASA